MSQTEFHTGKLKKINLYGSSLEDFCKEKCNEAGITDSDDWIEEVNDNFSKYDCKRHPDRQEYFIHNGEVYEVSEHYQSNDGCETFMNLLPNPDESISFMGQFYNGDTCFSEMLEEAIDKQIS